MRDAERLFWLRVQRRAASSSPDVAREILRAFEYLRQAIPEAELTRAIEQGPQAVLQLFDEKLLDTAFAPARREIVKTVSDATNYFARDIPKAAAFNVGFDVLNPRVIDAIRRLDFKLMTAIKDSTREVVRAHVENGLRDGLAPRTIAKDLRGYIGLSKNQRDAVRNYDRALRLPGKGNPSLGYKLRDRRYDALLGRGEKMTPEQIARAVTTYRNKMIAFHANTVTRTATVSAMKEGQWLAWHDAIENGAVDGSRLFKTWVNVGDNRVRDEHQNGPGGMGGETVLFDNPYSNGDLVPGESSWNCRCISRVFLKRAA